MRSPPPPPPPPSQHRTLWPLAASAAATSWEGMIAASSSPGLMSTSMTGMRMTGSLASTGPAGMMQPQGARLMPGDQMSPAGGSMTGASMPPGGQMMNRMPGGQIARPMHAAGGQMGQMGGQPQSIHHPGQMVRGQMVQGVGQMIRTPSGQMIRPGGMGGNVGGSNRESAQAAHLAKWEADEPLGENLSNPPTLLNNESLQSCKYFSFFTSKPSLIFIFLFLLLPDTCLIDFTSHCVVSR